MRDLSAVIKAYDIRGVVGDGIAGPTVRSIGAALARLLRSESDAAGLAHGLGEGRQVVAGVLRRCELALEPHHLPSPGGGEAVGVPVAQVVGVRLGLRGQRAHDGRGIGIDVGESGHRELGAPGPRTPPHTQHADDSSAWPTPIPVPTRGAAARSRIHR
jgi:hypothetical protein